jgi:hypothetical protein
MLAAMSGFRCRRRNGSSADPKAIELLPRELAERHCVLPLHLDGRSLHVAMLDPSDARLVGTLTRATNRHPALLPRSSSAVPGVTPRDRPVRRNSRKLSAATGCRQPDRPEKSACARRWHEAWRSRRIQLADLHQRLVLAARVGGRSGFGRGTRPSRRRPRSCARRVARSALPPRPSRRAGRVAVALARLHVPAAALLIVHRGMVMGLFGDGGELERHIGAVLVPIDAELGAGARARAGSIRCAAAGALDLLARARPADVRECSIAVRGRVVNLLYVDAGAAIAGGTRRCTPHALRRARL